MSLQECGEPYAPSSQYEQRARHAAQEEGKLILQFLTCLVRTHSSSDKADGKKNEGGESQCQ